MQVTNDSVVLFHYTLSELNENSEQGQKLESSDDGEPVAYLHGHKNILPILEDAMSGKVADEALQVTVAPEQGYGQRKAEAQQRVPIKHLVTKGRLSPGMRVQVNSERGVVDATVIKVGKFNVDLDTNHPFAGKTLLFDIKIVDVRAATAEEISHGHAHGPGGHNH